MVDLARRGQGEGVQGEHGGAVQGVVRWCRGLHFKEEETEAHRDDVGRVARTSGGLWALLASRTLFSKNAIINVNVTIHRHVRMLILDSCISIKANTLMLYTKTFRSPKARRARDAVPVAPHR